MHIFCSAPHLLIFGVHFKNQKVSKKFRAVNPSFSSEFIRASVTQVHRHDRGERGRGVFDILIKILSRYLQTTPHSACSWGDEAGWELQIWDFGATSLRLLLWIVEKNSVPLLVCLQEHSSNVKSWGDCTYSYVILKPFMSVQGTHKMPVQALFHNFSRVTYILRWNILVVQGKFESFTTSQQYQCWYIETEPPVTSSKATKAHSDFKKVVPLDFTSAVIKITWSYRVPNWTCFSRGWLHPEMAICTSLPLILRRI